MQYEGWVALEERFDDLGVSGGSLERPALRRLRGHPAWTRRCSTRSLGSVVNSSRNTLLAASTDDADHRSLPPGVRSFGVRHVGVGQRARSGQLMIEYGIEVSRGPGYVREMGIDYVSDR
jgi:hypothetical protein